MNPAATTVVYNHFKGLWLAPPIETHIFDLSDTWIRARVRNELALAWMCSRTDEEILRGSKSLLMANIMGSSSTDRMANLVALVEHAVWQEVYEFAKDVADWEGKTCQD